MSKDKLESLVKHMEETLSEMEQLKLHCGKQSEELSQLVVELRRENQELVEKYNQLAAEMKEAKEIIEQLQDTKYAFNAKERQAHKLSRQLWARMAVMGESLEEEENSSSLKISKYWVDLEEQTVHSCFLKHRKCGFFSSLHVYIQRE